MRSFSQLSYTYNKPCLVFLQCSCVFPANARNGDRTLTHPKVARAIALISTFHARNHRIDPMYTKKTPSELPSTHFLNEPAPPRGLNFIRPTISRISSVDVSVACEKRGLSSRLHCCSSTVGARPSSVWYMRNGLCRSAPRPCEPWSPRRWWCVVGISGAGSRGCDMLDGEDGGYKGVRRVLLWDRSAD